MTLIPPIHRRNSIPPGVIRSGYTLVEMLVVVAILSILMTLGVNAVKSGSRSTPAASEISSALRFARSFSIAQNCTTWVQFAIPKDKGENVELRFYHSSDGSGTTASMKQFRRRHLLENLRITNDLGVFGNRPDAPAGSRMGREGTIIHTSSGEAYLALGATGTFPEPPPAIGRIIELGIQPTVAGRVTERLQNDVAAIQIQGSPGTSIVYSK